MLQLSFGRTAAVFTALAFATTARPQDPEPLPLPLPPKTEKPDNRVVIVERGPIHEGFAQPGANVRGRGITAPESPPAPVNEIPPEVKLEGSKAQWIPGYWQWYDERNDFIWICGLYRHIPPGRTWEPGCWKEVRKVWTYFPGYWRPTDAKNLPADLPEPPPAKDEDTTPPKNNPNAMWVPGYWEYKNSEFEWQPGYWPANPTDMIWQPNQYVATETGFMFVPGYWDYPLEGRGLLYSPVFFSQAQRAKEGWSYRPEFAISFGSDSAWGQGGAFNSLYIGPNYNCYHYGNYSWSNCGTSAACGLSVWNCLPNFTNSVLALSGCGAYKPWSCVSNGYTNPLWQHYVRLNQSNAEWSKSVRVFYASGANCTTSPVCSPNHVFAASSTMVTPNRVTNTFTFSQPAGQVYSRRSTRMISTDGGYSQQFVTKNTMAYQYLSPRGNLKTGVMQTWTVSPPMYGYGR